MQQRSRTLPGLLLPAAVLVALVLGGAGLVGLEIARGVGLAVGLAVIVKQVTEALLVTAICSRRSREGLSGGFRAGPRPGRLPGGCVTGETHTVDLLPSDQPTAAARLWAGLDEPWQEAFRQAWETLRSTDIAVGACASTADGVIVHAARNRVNDREGPPGEIFGSALAHAEMNMLARLPFRRYRGPVLTTTLEACLQCAGAIRLGPIGTVRFAGADRYWDGCHDFGKLSNREAQRVLPARIGPSRDELGAFATLISRFGHLTPVSRPGETDREQSGTAPQADSTMPTRLPAYSF